MLPARLPATALLAVLSLGAAGAASAGSHLWRINEIFSNADGSVQYAEFYESAGSDDEWHLAGKSLHSDANSYVFPSHLPPETANRMLVVGTESYAAVPGAPAPDYIVPNGFFDTVADTVVLHTYDMFSYAAGELPTDGFNALNRFAGVVPNSPTNFAGETGVIDVGPDSDGDTIGDELDNCILQANASQSDADGDGLGNACDPDIAPAPGDCMVNFADLGVVSDALFADSSSPNWNAHADFNDDGAINFGDLAVVKAFFFGPPGPSALANACN